MEICMLCSGGCHGTSVYMEQSVLLAVVALPPSAAVANGAVFHCWCLLNAALDVYGVLKGIIMTDTEEEEDVGEAK